MAQWCERWPRTNVFDFQTRHYIRVEFVVGSRLCSSGFCPAPPVFPPFSKTKFQIPIRPGKRGPHILFYQS